jgi:hypothetical protein
MGTRGKIIAVLMGESKNALSGLSPEENKEGRSAPNYVGIVPLQKRIARHTDTIDGRDVTFHVKGYAPDIITVEGLVEVEDIFNDSVFDLKEKMIGAARTILQKHNTYKNFEEEYGIFCVSEYAAQPEEFLSFAPRIASFLKSEKTALDSKEIQQTLETSIKYAKDDLLIVDWDGAFIFDRSGQFDGTIALLELGNLQLLKYRILDYELDRRLDKLLKMLRRQQKERFSLFRSNEIKEIVREMIHVRSQSIMEFETIERNIKLIGDWYSAKVYSLLEKKFHLEEWRKNIKEKFETLEDVYAMASENFSLSFDKRMELFLLAGWFILQIGWFVLLFLEIIYPR